MSFPTWKSWLRTSPISLIPTKTTRVSNVTTIPPESKDRVTNRMHLLFQKDNTMQMVIFEPDEVMLKDIRNRAPRKVFMD